MRLLLLALALTLAAPPATAQPSRFEAPADLFYLHPLVNYSVPVRWQEDWERHRMAHGGLQVTVGSISTKDLATRVRVEASEPGGDHFRFLYRLDWTESPHLDGPEQQNWLGVEVGNFATPWGRVGAEIVTNPTSDKADVDVAPALVWTDASRRDYLRLGWRRDDFVYGDKNDLGATLEEEADGPTWVAHLERGPWSVSSTGTVLSPSERRFDDRERSPDLVRSRQERSWSSHALRHRGDRRVVELRLEHRDFERLEVAPAGAPASEDRRRDSRWRHLRLAWEEDLTPVWRVRAQLHRMHYDNEFETVTHERRETLAGVFVERALGHGHRIDLGWMGTDYSWTTTPDSELYGTDRDDFAAKVSLGWTLAFDDRGWFRALLSHEPDPQDFGGGSVLAQVRF
jgi:hypothetical protein